jgi:hypothetical protein
MLANGLIAEGLVYEGARVVTTVAIVTSSTPAWCRDKPPGESADIHGHEPQPVPFSHELHTRFVTQCTDYRAMPEPSWDITLLAGPKCVQYHIDTHEAATMRLAECDEEKKSVGWVGI